MGTEVPLLLFRVDGQRYGLPLDVVARVIPAVALAPLHGAPNAIRGVFIWQGEVVPTGDLRRRHRMAPREIALTDHIIITRRGDRLLGVLAEGTTGVGRFKPEDISDAATVDHRPDMLEGTAYLPDGIVLIQSIDRFLSPQEEASLTSAIHELH
jgi:chemotaxis signal transduction protein